MFLSRGLVPIYFIMIGAMFAVEIIYGVVLLVRVLESF